MPNGCRRREIASKIAMAMIQMPLDPLRHLPVNDESFSGIAAIGLHVPCRNFHVFLTGPLPNLQSPCIFTVLRSHLTAAPSSLNAYMKAMMRTSDRMSKAFQTRRSVSGMKGLLPLQLSSPSLPNIEIWPSPNSIQRSTFGFEESQTPNIALSENRKSTTRYGNLIRLPLSIRPQQYRDSPICYEPGSPLPKSPTESLHFHYSPSSSCDYTMDDGSSANTELDEQYETTSTLKANQESANQDKTTSWASNPTDVSRSSGLSFQCMGDPMFPNESAWLRSPTARWNGNFSRPRPEHHSKSMPESRKIESWLSERSFCDDEKDIFAQATMTSLPVAAPKAHVVDVSGKRVSGLSVKIPPRSSSLAGAHAMPITPDYSNTSWMDLDDSPATLESWERDNVTGELGSSPSFRPAPPEILSPPVSPTLYHHQRSHFEEQRPGVFPFSLDPQGSESFQAKPKLAPFSTADIVAALENSISHFPNTTLMHNTPCVLSIRHRLKESDPHISQNPDRQLLPAFDYDIQPSPQPGNQQKRQVTFSSSTPAKDTPWAIFSPSSDTVHSPGSYSSAEFAPHPPALQALHRIFPCASRSISTLYAYILAYIFTCSLQPSLDISAFASLRGSSIPHRSTSSASSKAANMLGISFMPPPPTSYHDDLSSVRVSRLVEQLNVCICRLVQVMRDAPDEAEYLDAEFLRSLVEVVRGYEMLPC